MNLQCRICGKEFPEFDQRGFRNAGFTAHQNRCIERERQRSDELAGRRSSRVASTVPRRLLPAPTAANTTATAGLYRRQQQQQEQQQRTTIVATTTSPRQRPQRRSRRRSAQAANASSAAATTLPLIPSSTLSVSTYYHHHQQQQQQPMVRIISTEPTPILLCSSPPLLVPVATTMPQESTFPTSYQHLTSRPTEATLTSPTLDSFLVHYCEYCTPQNGLHDPSCPLLSIFGPSSLGT